MIFAVQQDLKRRNLRYQKEERVLMKTALLLFSQKGFEQTTIEEIVQKANSSEEELYRYFLHKEDLLIRSLQAENQSFLRAWKKLWQKELPIEELILSSLLWLAHHYKKHYHLVGISTKQALISSQFAQLKQSVLLGPRAQIILEKLDSLKKRGKIRANVDVSSFIQIFFSIGFGIGFFGQIVYGHSPEKIQASIQESARLLSIGLHHQDFVSFD